MPTLDYRRPEPQLPNRQPIVAGLVSALVYILIIAALLLEIPSDSIAERMVYAAKFPVITAAERVLGKEPPFNTAIPFILANTLLWGLLGGGLWKLFLHIKRSARNKH